MSEPIFSASWYRVAELRPRLRSHARIHRHKYRGNTWFVLQDFSTGRFMRFTPTAHRVIGLMDGVGACAIRSNILPGEAELGPLRTYPEASRNAAFQGGTSIQLFGRSTGASILMSSAVLLISSCGSRRRAALFAMVLVPLLAPIFAAAQDGATSPGEEPEFTVSV